MREKEIDIQLTGYTDIKHGIELGSMLVQEGKSIVDSPLSEPFEIHTSKENSEPLIDQAGTCPGIAIGFDTNNRFCVFVVSDEHKRPLTLEKSEMAGLLVEHDLNIAAGFASDWHGSMIVNDEIHVDSGRIEEGNADKTTPVSCGVMVYFDSKSES